MHSTLLRFDVQKGITTKTIMVRSHIIIHTKFSPIYSELAGSDGEDDGDGDDADPFHCVGDAVGTDDILITIGET